MDVTGTVCAAARMDGSRTITYEIAVAKANTARAFQSSTAELAARVKPENKIAIGQLAPKIAFLGGGVPIVRDGTIDRLDRHERRHRGAGRRVRGPSRSPRSRAEYGGLDLRSRGLDWVRQFALLAQW